MSNHTKMEKLAQSYADSFGRYVSEEGLNLVALGGTVGVHWKDGNPVRDEPPEIHTINRKVGGKVGQVRFTCDVTSRVSGRDMRINCTVWEKTPSNVQTPCWEIAKRLIPGMEVLIVGEITKFPVGKGPDGRNRYFTNVTVDHIFPRYGLDQYMEGIPVNSTKQITSKEQILQSLFGKLKGADKARLS